MKLFLKHSIIHKCSYQYLQSSIPLGAVGGKDCSIVRWLIEVVRSAIVEVRETRLLGDALNEYILVSCGDKTRKSFGIVLHPGTFPTHGTLHAEEVRITTDTFVIPITAYRARGGANSNC
jgi:hypothetical protein